MKWSLQTQSKLFEMRFQFRNNENSLIFVDHLIPKIYQNFIVKVIFMPDEDVYDWKNNFLGSLWPLILKRDKKRWIFHRKNDISLLDPSRWNFVIMTEWPGQLGWKISRKVTFNNLNIVISFQTVSDSFKMIYMEITKILWECAIVKEP